MSGDFKLPVSIPLDDDGFLRRECPTCEQEFKWFSHEESSGDAEQVDQYFCPRCGVGSGVDSWWTTAQLEYVHGAAAPAIDQFIQDSVSDALKGLKGFSFKAGSNSDSEIPTPEALIEPNDMVIVEPPCHPNEPVKVPPEATARVYCLICGDAYAV